MSQSAGSCRASKSKCVQHFDSHSKHRYALKLAIAGVTDPYSLPTHLFTPIEKHPDATHLPNLQYPDIVNYLIENSSYYTGAKLKAYKSLDGYKYFVAGWVHGVQTWAVPGKQRILVMAKVNHSQRLNEPPLQPWLSIQEDGQVLCAHCNCMAGLGEVCSHVAATLFALETAVRLLQDKTCTSKPCEWIRPSSQKIQYAVGHEIDFTSPQRKRKQQMCNESVTEKQSSGVLASPTPEEAEEFYSDLAKTGTKCAVLSVVASHAHAYIPSVIAKNLPLPLPDLLFDENCIALCRHDLIGKSKVVFRELSITHDVAESIEKETRGQSKSASWFNFRAGRVTASNFKAAAHTDPNKPSKSLIKRICYPQSYAVRTAATMWGCTHEATALQAYRAYLQQTHSNPVVSATGLHLSTCYPHLGASPDGVVACTCCESGIVEVKCPYCIRSSSIEEAASNAGFCLHKTDTGAMQLNSTHQYYYQVQAQLHVTGAAFCDFVLYSEHDDLFVQRIHPDAHFWGTTIERVNEFYIHGVLPELIGKCYTRESTQEVTSAAVDGLCCYCQQPPKGDMLHCKSKTCSIVNFHLVCVGLKRVPKRDWYCAACRKLKKTLVCT